MVTPESVYEINKYFYGHNYMKFEAAVRDAEIINARMATLDQTEGPRVGDFVRFPDGRVHQFSHDWGESLQTSASGSFYHAGSHLSFSGGLDPAIPTSHIFPTSETKLGYVWIFSQGLWGAGRRVEARVELRVFEYRPPVGQSESGTN